MTVDTRWHKSSHSDASERVEVVEATRPEDVPAAVIIREGVLLAAMAHRQWDEPFFDEPLDLGGRVHPDEWTGSGPR
ncbi:DUF397 domain-containing protein [Solwaraspora sp. WMMD406]|uniref:DUF397 domain-containing protein n=1 Tax=Solwaraspora sp. WMMD406 TaxID=3016095 RepID=UPI002416098D|nr:DUF397 domain-containing protein [Solwaraspora sp. WMMD406]MDG4767566.1 DUF397 domain-containing protein [Solwaraspora sp. WMMD406]